MSLESKFNDPKPVAAKRKTQKPALTGMAILGLIVQVFAALFVLLVFAAVLLATAAFVGWLWGVVVTVFAG